MGAKQSGDDYGKVSIDGAMRYTHRISAHLWLGLPLDSPLFVRHRCIGNHACFQPQHLLIGTQAENNRDTTEHGRHRNGGAIDTRLLGDLIWSIRKGRITIGKWAVVKRLAYKTAYNAYHGISHTAEAAVIHSRCDARYGSDANPILNPRQAVQVRPPAGCRVTPAGLIVVDPVVAGIVADELEYANDESLPDDDLPTLVECDAIPF